MDLSERTDKDARRHPWETSRALAIEQIVRGLGLDAPCVLDVGSGDGYLLQRLHSALHFRRALGVDIHLSDELAAELSRSGVELMRELGEREYRAELILLLDVLEHVAEPGQLLQELTRERLAEGGRFVITVPAFQQLYSDHDRALKHYCRYSRPELLALVQGAGLEVIDSGYLFSSLLLPRAAMVARERMLPRRGAVTHGVGAWQGGGFITRLLHRALVLDNRLCLAARKRGLRLPGMTVWLTCKKPS